jgi:transcriptional regulator with XRE-family HTH domain
LARLSLEELAERIGLDVPTLALWEQDVLPKEDGREIEAFGRLCRVLGFGASFLLGIDEPEPREGA